VLRVFIADDESPARARLKELLADLAAELPAEVVGEAANGLEAIERHGKHALGALEPRVTLGRGETVVH